jgi:hypothetical protein
MKVGLCALGYYALFFGSLYCHNLTFNIALYEMMLIDFKHSRPVTVICDNNSIMLVLSSIRTEKMFIRRWIIFLGIDLTTNKKEPPDRVISNRLRIL